jgi:hypothetical protein
MTKEDKLKKDIDSVDEVLSWDPRGCGEEYKLLEKAIAAFDRIKKVLESKCFSI